MTLLHLRRSYLLLELNIVVKVLTRYHLPDLLREHKTLLHSVLILLPIHLTVRSHSGRLRAILHRVVSFVLLTTRRLLRSAAASFVSSSPISVIVTALVPVSIFVIVTLDA